MNDFLKYLCNPTTIALVLGGILTSFFGFLAGISKSEKTPKWIAWGSFIAGIVVLGAGIFSGYQDQITSASLQEKTEKIAEISQKNADLASKNSELNQKIANLVTGGDSYGYVMISDPSKSNISDMTLSVRGGHPLYDVEVQVQDIQKFNEYVRNEIRKHTTSGSIMSDFYNRIYKTSKIFKIGNMSSNQGRFLGELSLPKNSNRARYHIFIYARNGRVLQHVEFRKIKGKWIRAEKSFFNNKVVEKYIHPDFPKDERSKEFWEE